MEERTKVIIENKNRGERVFLSLTDDQYRLLTWLFDQCFFDAGVYEMREAEEMKFEEI